MMASDVGVVTCVSSLRLSTLAHIYLCLCLKPFSTPLSIPLSISVCFFVFVIMFSIVSSNLFLCQFR